MRYVVIGGVTVAVAIVLLVWGACRLAGRADERLHEWSEER